ncbi:hypothetical protein ACH5RR_032000, partial [Cinchona calisaya]
MARTSTVRLPVFIIKIRSLEFAAKKTLFPLGFLDDYAFDIQDSVKLHMPSSDMWCIVFEKNFMENVVTYWLN